MNVYDPDGQPFHFERIDELTVEQASQLVDQWLDDPNTLALHDDIGRYSRSLPASEQLTSLRAWLPSLESHIVEVDALTDREDLLEVRPGLAEQSQSMKARRDAIRHRIAELEAEI
jgi:hypothetical protein